MLVKIIIFSFLFLLANVESSLQTSIVLDRSTAHSAWLFKVGILSIADYILIFATIITIARFVVVKKLFINKTPYVNLILLMMLYLFIGILYNIFVFFHLKTFFYDSKVVLWLIIPFLFLLSANPDSTRKISIFSIFTLFAIGKVIDFLIVYFFEAIEYPSLLGIQVFPSLLPCIVAIVGIAISKKIIHKIFFIVIMLFDIFNAVNRLSLGVVFNYMTAPLILLVFWPPVKIFSRYALLTLLLFSITIFTVYVLYNPFGIVANKAEGAKGRVIATENFWANAQENIPGFIGKGLGSTYFDRVGRNKQDLYSVGTSMGNTFGKSDESEVLFIMHGPMGPFYKWGLIGYLLLLFLIVRYHNYYFNKLRKLKSYLSDKQCRLLFAELLITSWFLVNYLTSIGQVSPSMMTSLLVYIVHRDFKLTGDMRFSRQVAIIKNQKQLPYPTLTQGV